MTLSFIYTGLRVNEKLYSYAWLSVSKEKKTFCSISLADGDETFPHARLYYVERQKEPTLLIQEAETMSDNQYMKLLIIVNSENDYKFQALPTKKWKTPVILVTAKTGGSLRKYICTGHIEEPVMELFLISSDNTKQCLQLGTEGVP